MAAQYESEVDALIRRTRTRYRYEAALNRRVYYATRLVAGFSAALLPFIVVQNWGHQYAIALSLLIVIATVIDQVFNPKDRWALLHRAISLITLARIKTEGDYENNKEAVDAIMNTEAAVLQQVTGLKEAVDQISQVARGASVPVTGAPAETTPATH